MSWLNWIKAFFGGSKKATTVLIGILTIIFRDALGLPPDVIEFIVQIIVGYLVAQGAVDVSLAFRRKT